MRWILISALAALLATPALAWDMNTDINATNFIVADQCSGTLISTKYKLVLTNEHCLQGFIDKVEKEETVGGEIKKVTREVFKDMDLKQKSYKDFEPVGSATLQAKILVHVAKFDLALLQIKADTIPQTVYSHVLPAGKEVKRGDHVFVVGNPYMFDANLTEGVISSINRTLHWSETNEDIPYYGVDAGINPGNSGGALYNTDGELIGVPAAGIRGATGLGFAIPAKVIRQLLSENCYEDVWNDAALKDHTSCIKDKKDADNIRREKAGLPPVIDAPTTSSFGTPVKPSPLWLERLFSGFSVEPMIYLNH